MNAPSSTPTPPPPQGSPSSLVAPSTTSSPTELVTRPDPGLARGNWEAPRAAFYVVVAVVVVLAIVAALRKLGVFARLRIKP